MKYISPKTAQDIDTYLMQGKGSFTLEQLMELAGQACAVALAKSFPLSSSSASPENRRVLVACGPGNQGGDGLVAARHLSHFGYLPTLYVPKPSSNPFLSSLLTQCQNLHISLLPSPKSLSDASESLSALKSHLDSETDVVMDALFGFSFKPPVRAPFGEVLKMIGGCGKPIVSVDIPSGWDVSSGPLSESETGFPSLQPEVLISLTAPKEGVRFFKGSKHWLGGRFIPPDVAKMFELELPPYEGIEVVLELNVPGEEKGKEEQEATL